MFVNTSLFKIQYYFSNGIEHLLTKTDKKNALDLAAVNNADIKNVLLLKDMRTRAEILAAIFILIKSNNLHKKD